MNKFVLALGLCFLAALARGQDNQYVTLLPVGKQVVATVTQLGSSPEYEALAIRFAEAMAKNPEWLKKYIEEHDEPGKPLPYHPNFGLTKQEYEQSQRDSGSAFKLVELGKIQLSVERDGDALRLSTIPATFPLNGVQIDRQGRWARIKDVELVERTEINQSNPSSATGIWAGVQWRYQSTDPGSLPWWNFESIAKIDSLLMMQLALGRREKQGDGLLYLDITSVRDKKRDVYHYVVLFPVAD